MIFAKNDAPDLMVEVVKKRQTCTNWQGEVEEGMAKKTIWDNDFYEKSSIRSSGWSVQKGSNLW